MLFRAPKHNAVFPTTMHCLIISLPLERKGEKCVQKSVSGEAEGVYRRCKRKKSASKWMKEARESGRERESARK